MRKLITITLWICVFTLCAQDEMPVFPGFTEDEVSKTVKTFIETGQLEKGISYLHRWTAHAMPGIVTHEDSVALFQAQLSMSSLLIRSFKLDSVEVVLKPALKAVTKKFPKKFVQLHHNYGIMLIYSGKYAEGQKLYDSLNVIIEGFGEILEPKILLGSQLNHGISYNMQGDSDNALAIFKRVEAGLKRYNLLQDRIYEVLQFNYSSAYSNLGEWDKYVVHNRKAYEFALNRLGPDHPLVAQNLNGVANGMKMTGDEEGALKVYFEAREVFNRINQPDHAIKSIIDVNIAETLQDLGRTEEAVPYVNSSIKIRKKVYGLVHPEVQRSFKARATIQSDLLQFEEAFASIDSALMALGFNQDSEHPYHGVEAMFNLFYTMDHRASIYYDRAKHDNTKENWEAALAAYQEGIAVLNDLRRHFKGKLSKGNLNKKSYGFYEPAIDVCMQRFQFDNNDAYLFKALQLAHESKNNDFYNLARYSSELLFANIPDSIKAEETAIHNALSDLENQLYSLAGEEDSLRLVAQLTLHSKEQGYRDFQEKLETEYPEYFNVMYSKYNADYKAIQNQLKRENRAYVEYFMGDENAYAIVLGPQDIHAIRLENPDTIIQVFNAWKASSFENRNIGFDESHLKQLSQFIWQPVEEVLPSPSALAINPDGVLAYIPFEALHTRNGNYLNEEFTVSYRPEVGQAQNGYRNAFGKENWLGVAPEYEDVQEMTFASRGLDSAKIRLRDENLIALPGARAEVESIRTLMQGDALTGKNATEAEFKNKASAYDILHLSMHAWTDDGDPLLSTLIFTDKPGDTLQDNHLHAYEIFQLDLPSRLAVLSACNTGTGKYRRGEGISSLARAFQYAGVRTTVMSLWKVPDASTVRIMTAFYTHMKAGLAVDKALQQAKLDYLAEITEPELRHPYYWAGFVLQGENYPLTRKSNWMWWLSGFAGAGILIYLLFFRKSA